MYFYWTVCIVHCILYFSVQFHPEAMGGPEDLEHLFDVFIQQVKASKNAFEQDISIKDRLDQALRYKSMHSS